MVTDTQSIFQRDSVMLDVQTSSSQSKVIYLFETKIQVHSSPEKLYNVYENHDINKYLSETEGRQCITGITNFGNLFESPGSEMLLYMLFLFFFTSIKLLST